MWFKKDFWFNNNIIKTIQYKIYIKINLETIQKQDKKITSLTKNIKLTIPKINHPTKTIPIKFNKVHLTPTKMQMISFTKGLLPYNRKALDFKADKAKKTINT